MLAHNYYVKQILLKLKCLNSKSYHGDDLRDIVHWSTNLTNLLLREGLNKSSSYLCNFRCIAAPPQKALNFPPPFNTISHRPYRPNHPYHHPDCT